MQRRDERGDRFKMFCKENSTRLPRTRRRNEMVRPRPSETHVPGSVTNATLYIATQFTCQFGKLIEGQPTCWLAQRIPGMGQAAFEVSSSKRSVATLPCSHRIRLPRISDCFHFGLPVETSLKRGNSKKNGATKLLPTASTSLACQLAGSAWIAKLLFSQTLYPKSSHSCREKKRFATGDLGVF